MLALRIQRANQLMITLRCLPIDDPAYPAVLDDLRQARLDMYTALCTAC